jgi:sulfur transfer complex TusBCD TusB component (DsrH family)
MANKVLSIVETAYRATIEEQDDTILWLSHMLKTNGLDLSLLLRSNAVNYAVSGQDASGLRVGDIEVAHPPVIDRDVAVLVDLGVPVYYVSDDARARGIVENRIVDGVKWVSRTELPALFASFDHIWHW